MKYEKDINNQNWVAVFNKLSPLQKLLIKLFIHNKEKIYHSTNLQEYIKTTGLKDEMLALDQLTHDAKEICSLCGTGLFFEKNKIRIHFVESCEEFINKVY